MPDLVDALTDAVRRRLNDEIAWVEAEIDRVAKTTTQSQWARQPQHEYHDELVAFFAPKIAAALKDSTTGIRTAVTAAQKKYLRAKNSDATKASGDDAAHAAASDAISSNVTMSPKEARQILQWLYSDSYATGAHSAVTQIGGGATVSAAMQDAETAIDWSKWTPGNEAAADLVRGEGLQDLLDQAGITIQNVQDAAMVRLGNALADGLASGQSVDSLASSLSDIVDGNAYAIANTETARAMSSAALDTYTANDVSQISWLAEDSACPECSDLADGSPYDVDSAPDLPDHPNCRCTYLPVVTDVDGNNIAPTSDDGDQSDASKSMTRVAKWGDSWETQDRAADGEFGSGHSVADVAAKASADAKAAEPALTSAMQGAAERVGGTMVGTEFAVKEPGSLGDKITEKITEAKAEGKTLTPEQALAGIHDVNRYTMTASPENYEAAVKGTVEHLESQGYKFQDSRWKNTWAPGNPYRGLNTTVKAPDGRSVELQFHTKESFDTKQANHADYERERSSDTPASEKQVLQDRMASRAAAVTAPRGALGLTKPPR